MKNNTTYSKEIILLTIASFILFLFSRCSNLNGTHDSKQNSTKLNKTNYPNPTEEKQKGAHVFGQIDSTNNQLFLQNNMEWITLVPWGFQQDYDSPKVGHHNGDSLMMARSDSNWVKRLESVHAAGFKIFLKPHVWMDSNPEEKWRSDIFPVNEENWKLWKQSYRHFIFRYAKIAERGKVEMFCVGAEFSRLSVEKPLFWKTLIQEIRSIYTGKITYAANWYNEYEKITFWEDLDYIGIQAYFPLVKNKRPTTEEISKGWNKYLPTLESISKKYKRKILFTEMGYKSTADSAVSPWEWVDDPAISNNKNFSPETQTNCYKSFFNTIWPRDWFAGVHIWQLRGDYSKEAYEQLRLDFTPQGKPAEKVIADGFE